MSSFLLVPPLLLLFFLYTPAISIECHTGMEYDTSNDTWSEERNDFLDNLSLSLHTGNRTCVGRNGTSCGTYYAQDPAGAVTRLAYAFCHKEECPSEKESKCKKITLDKHLEGILCCCNGDFCWSKEYVENFLEEYGNLPVETAAPDENEEEKTTTTTTDPTSEEPEIIEETRKPMVIPDYPDEQGVGKGKRHIPHFWVIIVGILVI